MESGLGDFLQQVPIPLIGTLCLSAVVLVGVLAYIFQERSKKRQKAAVANSGGMADVSLFSPSSDASAGDDLPLPDLPDLDVLTSAPVAPAPPPSRPAGMQRLRLTEGESVEAVEVLTILRDVADGGLLVQIGDKVYRNPPAVADPEFKRRFNLTMKELASGNRVTLETPAAKPTAPAAPSASTDAPLVTAADPVEPTAAPPTPPRATTSEARPVMATPPTVPLPGDLPKFKMPDQIEPPRRGRKAPPKEVIPEINIAAAIESYLQHKLAQTPAYATRSIHVRPAAHGGVEIDVDGHIYEAVSDIADADVRAFMANTIEEWQSRQ
ncbi:MAG: hypothetical protein J0M07_25705 [Anaerolineae bacterium]|nr:hypothetical protein [Anaerolineae bacterium]